MSWRRHPEQPVAEIGFIATAPAARRYGRASRLLRECEAWARGQGVEMLRTRPFVDSRYEPACRLLERCGFEVREPQHMNTTWEIDIRSWQPREPFLPEGYTLTWLCAEREADWTALHRAIFGSEATVEWFHRRFADQPNYDPQGWFLIDYDGRAVAMAGAIVWFEDAALARPSGALIEWVGVLPEERGRGLGEAVMVACLNYLKQRAVYPNCLITQYFREAAVGVYRKLGYHFVRECRTYQKRL
jgi:GNAT superfamily N-acetyltransferase